MNLSRNNHFIPRMYLNNWTTKNGEIYTYRLLVSDERVPEWSKKPVSSTGSHTNLYVRTQDGNQIDDFEHDLDRRFESPAREALEKAVSLGKLTSDDWHRLTDFVCALYVRTPAFYLYSKDLGMKVIPGVLEEVCKELETLSEDNIPKIGSTTENDSDLIPISLAKVPEAPDAEHTVLEINTIVGKNTWLFFMKHSLEENSCLRECVGSMKWSIVTASENVRWPSTDNPVTIVQETGNNQYSIIKDGLLGKNVFLLKRLERSANEGGHFRLNEDDALSDLYDRVYKAIILFEKEALISDPSPVRDALSWKEDFNENLPISDVQIDSYLSELAIGINYPEKLQLLERKEEKKKKQTNCESIVVERGIAQDYVYTKKNNDKIVYRFNKYL